MGRRALADHEDYGALSASPVGSLGLSALIDPRVGATPHGGGVALASASVVGTNR